ncbi:hypothetical protein ME7_01187, partial [Bartonella birtlesii LL-WM9]
TGNNTLDATGLVIGNGPKITPSGIDAGGKKIWAIAHGDISKDSTEAVNGSQIYKLTRGLAINTTDERFRDAVADRKDSIAIGNLTKALSDNTVAIGSYATASAMNAIAIGPFAKALVGNSIALGGSSIADVEAGVASYDPRTRKNELKQDNTWVSSLGALSIGDAKKGITRQIVGVAAGTKDTDAVNVAQLKALQDATYPNWELSVDGKNKTNVNADNPMDLAAGSANLTLTKG